MLVVSNTSPIINLAAINQLGLLEQLYGQIVIPSAVYDEIVVHGAGQPGASDVQNATWIEQRTVTNVQVVGQLLGNNSRLDRAEAEAIVLALDIQADRLLIDETRGRTTATSLGIPIRGILGVLLDAKQHGLITSVKPLLDDLVTIARFFVAQPVYDQTLRTAGE